LSSPLDKLNLKIDALAGKYFQSSNIAVPLIFLILRHPFLIAFSLPLSLNENLHGEKDIPVEMDSR
jgi:hypothetical protein